MINKDTVLKTAGLTKLELNEGESQKLTQELTQILTFIDKLNELDTKEVAPLSHGYEVLGRMREDSALKEHPDRQTALNLASQKDEDGSLIVPNVIRK